MEVIPKSKLKFLEGSWYPWPGSTTHNQSIPQNGFQKQQKQLLKMHNANRSLLHITSSPLMADCHGEFQ